MAEPLTCPRGHRWQPNGAESATPPPICPVCGLALQPSREHIAPTLDYQTNPPPESVSSSTPPPEGMAHTRPIGDDAPTLPRTPDETSRGSMPVFSQHIPGYEILGELGRGGMGVVYKARQSRLNRIVALKMVLAGAQAEKHQLERFRAEAEAVARLQHPYIVQIYEISEQDGCPFFSLEYVDGGTLAQKLNGAPQPPRLAAQFVRLLALAMHSAHQKGIIHRDLKPGNILLATPTEHVSNPDSFQAESQAALRLYGIPKVTDFGLAKHLDIQSQTRTGAILGTPSYMAPEQAEARAHAIGPATDVYALGAILYEMLTGRPPFEGDSSLTTIRQLLTEDPISPSRLHKVPVDLETICLKCLEKDPARRYPSAEELADDLHRFLKNEPIEARPVGWWGRTVKWTRRHPARAALFAVVSGASLALLIVGLSYHFRLEHAVDEARLSAEENRQNLIRLHVTEGTSAMNAGDGFTALLWFTEALRLDPGTPEHEKPHRERIAALMDGLPRLSQVWVHEGAVNEAHFSPDGRRVLTAGDDGRAYLWDGETGAAVAPPMVHGGPVLRALFSPDGRRIATASQDHTARVWDAKTGQALTPPLAHNGPVHWIDFSPDGTQVATVSDAESARVWDVATGKPLAGELNHGGDVTQIAFSPDGRWLATAGDDGLVHLWDAATRKPSSVTLLHDRAILCLAFSHDGKHIATGSADHSARVWDVLTGAPVTAPLRHRGRVTQVVYSPFDHRLLTGGEDGLACIWRVADGERLAEPLRHKSAIRAAAFSPDGCRAVTGGDDNIVRVWNTTTGASLTPPLRYNGNVNHVAFNAEGDRLVTASDDGTARLWTVASRHRAVVVDEAAVFRRSADRALRVAVADSEPSAVAPADRTSPDGRLVVKIGDRSTARVFDAATGLPVTPPLRHHNDITYVAFSPDSKHLVTTSADQTARVWDAVTGAAVGPPLTHASSVGFADFSPDGLRLVTASEDNSARVWAIATGELLLPPLKHDGTVTQALFSANGRRVASASLDQTARVWDAETGQALTPPLQHPWPLRQVRFSADGQRLLVTGSSGAVWSWDLPCSDCVTDDLVRLAQLLSGNRLDAHRGIMPLKPRELRQTWEALRQSRDEFFRFSAEDVTAWHGQAGQECIRGQHWEAALWHLERTIQAAPEAWLPRARRGLVRAELGRWPDAQADFAEVVRRAPTEAEAWCLYALLCVQNRDWVNYRRACAALVKRSRQDDTPRTAYLTAWACALSEESGVKGGQAIELAERAVSSQPHDTDYLCTLGAVLFRAGELDAAARRLHEGLKLRGRRPSPRQWLWLSMVLFRKGQTKEAETWLARATPIPARPADLSPLPWVARLRLNLLQREAEGLLRSDRSNPK